MKHICKYCNKEFPTSQKLGGHVSRCPERQDAKEIQEKSLKTRKKNLNKIERELICPICGNHYNVICSDNDFNKGKYKKTCSSKCAHILTSNNTNKENKNIKISKSLLNIETDNIDEYIEVVKQHKDLNRKKKSYKNLNYLRSKLPYQFKHLDIGQCWFCGKYNCQDDFCKKVGFNHIKFLIKNFGFDSLKLSTPEAINEYNRIRNLLYKLYHIDHMTMGMIKDYFKIDKESSSFMYSLFDKMKISHRNLSEALHISYLEGRTNLPNISKGLIFHTEYHKTWENKIYYLRSGNEINYANFLDQNKIRYDVENLRIEYLDSQLNKNRIAIPDFYLPDSNTIVEIKSTYTLNLHNMIDKFNQYNKLGYNTKLILNNEEVDINSLV